jgi:hypothetical protein
MMGVGTGMLLAVYLAFSKVIWHIDVMDQHGPLMVFAAVLIVSGVQLLALGLLGELQVRHRNDPSEPLPYSIEKVIGAHGDEQEKLAE